jgi:hypothetical protein
MLRFSSSVFLKELAIVADVRVLNVTVRGTTHAAKSIKLPLSSRPSRPVKPQHITKNLY